MRTRFLRAGCFRATKLKAGCFRARKLKAKCFRAKKLRTRCFGAKKLGAGCLRTEELGGLRGNHLNPGRLMAEYPSLRRLSVESEGQGGVEDDGALATTAGVVARVLHAVLLPAFPQQLLHLGVQKAVQHRDEHALR